MAISLSEQLESDIKEYLHKTFGTYFSSLDERFAADIKEDVINASDFHHGYYNDDDISIAFQRVTLGSATLYLNRVAHNPQYRFCGQSRALSADGIPRSLSFHPVPPAEPVE